MNNKKNIVILGIVFAFSFNFAFSQERMYTKSATIKFFSKAPLENIEAVSKTGLVVLDKVSKKIEASMLLQSFSFEKALMQEHFNENYVESTKYPKAVFKGNFDPSFNSQQILTKVTTLVKGNLTLHGITKPITATVTLIPQENSVNAMASFTIILANYNISIPSVVKDKISADVNVSVNAVLENFKK